MTPHSSNKLLIAIVSGITIGIFLGGFFPAAGRSVQFLGTLFLNALFLMVVPLVMSSMIVGVSSLGDVRKIGRLGGLAITYFMVTTGLAVLVGLLLVLAIEPGAGMNVPSVTDDLQEQLDQRMDNRPETLGDLLENILTKLVPKNLISAMVNTDVLPLIIFSLVFGGALTTLGEKGKIVIRFFEGVNEAIMAMVHLLMWTAPVGIGALIAGRLGKAEGFVGFWPQVSGLGAYTATVIIALMIHGIITLPLILRFVGKHSPITYAKNLGTALTTAFSTSSSSATLPLTLEGVIERQGISPKIGRFVIPLGATINMNGTALYEAVAAPDRLVVEDRDVGVGAVAQRALIQMEDSGGAHSQLFDQMGHRHEP